MTKTKQFDLVTFCIIVPGDGSVAVIVCKYIRSCYFIFYFSSKKHVSQIAVPRFESIGTKTCNDHLNVPFISFQDLCDLLSRNENSS